jgi:hypothetical protein
LIPVSTTYSSFQIAVVLDNKKNGLALCRLNRAKGLGLRAMSTPFYYEAAQ